MHSNGISCNLRRSQRVGVPCATANVWTNPHIIQSIVNPITHDVMLLVGVTHNENVSCIGNDLISRSNSAFADHMHHSQIGSHAFQRDRKQTTNSAVIKSLLIA